MNTLDEATGMDPKVKAELQDLCDQVAKSVQTSSQEKLEAIASLNEMREKIRKRIGVQNIAADLVRQSRDSQ